MANLDSEESGQKLLFGGETKHQLYQTVMPSKKSYEMEVIAEADKKDNEIADAKKNNNKKDLDTSVDILDPSCSQLPCIADQDNLQLMDLDKYSQATQDTFEDLDRPKDSKIFDSMNSAASLVRNALFHKVTKYLVIAIFGIAFIAYFCVCIWHFAKNYSTSSDDDKESSIRLFWVTGALFVWFILHSLHKYLGPRFNLAKLIADNEVVTSIRLKLRGNELYVWYGIQLLIILGFVIWVGVNRVENLISFVGMLVLLFIAFLCSRDHAMINIRPVLGGLVLQLLFAVLVLRTDWGYAMFDFLGKRVSEFLIHANAGASFIFGGGFREHFFAFAILPIVIFFSAVISVLFHFGILTYIISKIGSTMELLMGTTTTESLVAAANIFIGQTEAPLMIAPFLKAMTNAEIHSVMTSGFATIAGSVLAAYIAMGVSSRHLLGASVMSAPAALAVSKLMYPETKKVVITPSAAQQVKLEKHSNFIEAAGVGAINAIKMVAAIAANIIAFISVLAFMNATLTWFGYRTGLEVPVTFETICSYVLWPLAFVMGVPAGDCFRVAELIGVKTFVNEFVAYQRLGEMEKNYPLFMNYTQNGTLDYFWRGNNIIVPAANNATLVYGVLFEERSIIIATYSLCGFANLGSIGILIGGLSALAPNRRRDIVDCVVSAMIAGNIACFLTACIAGLFFEPTPGFRS